MGGSYVSELYAYHWRRCVEYASIPLLKEKFKLTDEQVKLLHKAKIRKWQYPYSEPTFTVYCVEDVKEFLGR